VLPLLEEEYIKTGKVYYIFKDLPVFGNESMTSATAAECAGELGDYWAMHDWLFQNQNAWKFKPEAADIITQGAIELGFDETAFKECLHSSQFKQEITDDFAEARKIGAQGTPTFMINGRRYTGFITWNNLQGIVERMLTATTPEATVTR